MREALLVVFLASIQEREVECNPCVSLIATVVTAEHPILIDYVRPDSSVKLHTSWHRMGHTNNRMAYVKRRERFVIILEIKSSKHNPESRLNVDFQPPYSGTRT